ncbi:MAG: serine--tRNA ligase, partial [bacterium]|nr:serine--tRNA ligase [bacterium]
MFDVKLILENKDKVLKSLMNRNFKDLSLIDEIVELSEKRKTLVTESEHARATQNQRSKEMPLIMK